MREQEPHHYKDRTPEQLEADHKAEQLRAALAAEKTKRRSRPLLTVLLSLLLLGLGAAAAIYIYKSFFEPKTDTVQTDQTKTVVQNDRLTAQEVIDEIKAAYPDTEVIDEPTTQPIKVAGYDYYTGTPKDGTVGVQKSVPADQAPIDVALIGKVLTDKGLTRQSDENNNHDDRINRLTNFAHKDVVCQLDETPTMNNPAGDHLLKIACATMADYASDAKAAKPFHAALPANQKSELLVLGVPAEKESETAGYKLGELTLKHVHFEKVYASGDTKGLFYQTPDKTWHFFTETKDAPACSEFTTEELKKAYAGEACNEGSTRSTVQ